MSVYKIGNLSTSTCDNNLKTVVQFHVSKPKYFTNSCHSIQLLEDLQSLRENEELCDVKFETNNGTIVVGHKNVLVAASKYFHDMFSSGDYNNKVVIIRNLDSFVLQILIDYIYTGKIKVTYENVKVLLPAANILQLDYVSSACVEYLQKYIDASNCLSIKAFADLHKCTELMSSSEAFIKKNFLEIIKGDEFILLTCEKVIELISCNDIAVPSEEKIFECVIKWVKHDLDLREQFLLQLMEHVRLPLLAATPNILYNIIEEPLLKNCPKYNDIVSEALHFHLLRSVQYFTIPQTIRCKPRQFGRLKKIILLFNPNTISYKCNIEWFDPATNLLKNVAELICFGFGIGVVRDQFIFAIGGVNELCTQTVWMLDVSSSLSHSWINMPKLLVDRIFPEVGVLDDSIYVIGGVDSKSNVLSSVEVFDVNIQKWRMVTSMNTNRKHFGVGVLSGRLYAVGGHDGSYSLKSVECYDPKLVKWTPVADLSVKRLGVSIGVLNGVMYAVGGNNGVTCLRSVEAYRPSDGVWSSIADMNLSRLQSGVVALDGLLYVFGGIEELDYCTMEVYDPNTNIWSLKKLSKNDKFSKFYNAVVVNRPSNFTID